MPPPRVVCSICGQEVNKAQTLHIGDGKRACRSHEGTADASKKECTKIEQQKKDELKKAAQKKQRKIREIPTLEPQCMICGKTGILQQEWYTRLMIEMKKYEIIHGKPINALFGDIKKAGSALVGINCLFHVIWHGDNTNIRIPFQAYEFVKLSKQLIDQEPILLVCQDCVRENGFTTATHERFSEMMKSDMFFQISDIMHSVIEPQIEKMAIQEISESN